MLERGQADADSRQFAFATLFGAAHENSPALLDECATIGRVRRAGGDVSKGPQQTEADGDVALRIHADLLECGIHQAAEVDPGDSDANHAGRIVEQRFGRSEEHTSELQSRQY